MSQIPRMETIKATAKISGLPEHFIRTLCTEGKICAVQAGNKWLVNIDRLVDYLNAPPVQLTQEQPKIRAIAE